MIYILILQNPLRIQSYSSLAALIEDNSIEDLKASESKLRKWNWNTNYVDHNVIISKRETLTSGDVRRKKTNE